MEPSSSPSQQPPNRTCFPEREEPPSPYEVMLQSAPSDYLTNIEEDNRVLPPDYPVYYFFYGTLTTPATLQRILDLEEEPTLRKAQIIGYELLKWGDYPALVNGEQGQPVLGAAYLLQSKGQAQKLAYYETSAYRVAACWIYFTDGDDDQRPVEAPGKVFMYAGDADALREQRFDRKLWALQMGNRLT